MSDDNETRALALRRGYAIESADDGDEREVLRLRAPDGRICLKIILTPTGPEVEIASASLSIATDGDVNVACGRFAVDARGGIALRAGEDLETEAFAQRHRARRGDILLKANDDVQLDGERIRLNSPRDLTPTRA